MRIPPTAAADVKEAFRELHERIDKFLGAPNAGHANIKGKRITNAGDAIHDADLVTLRQLQAAVDGQLPVAAPSAVIGSGDGGGGSATPGTCNSAKPDYSGYVAAAKATLVGMAEDLSGACGAFKITKLAAKNIQAVDNTVGLLAKPSGNNCDGYSVDVLCFIDGAQYDVLGDAGGANTTQFSFVLCGDPTRYRAPLP